MSKFQTTSFDPSKITTEETATHLFQGADYFAAKFAHYPELRDIYDRLSSKKDVEEYSLEERNNGTKTLLQEISKLTEDASFKDMEIPLSLEAKEKINKLTNYGEEGRSKQFAIVLARAVLGIQEGKSTSDITKQIDSDIVAFDEKVEEQICRDLNRTNIQFKKDGIEYPLDLRNVIGESAVIPGYGEYKKAFSEFNEKNKLGLSLEQMEFILRSCDQGCHQGAGTNFCLKKNYESFLMPSGTTSQIIEINDEKITQTFTFPKNVAAIADPGETIGHLLHVIESDLSGLREETYKSGLCSRQVPTKITYSHDVEGLDISMSQGVSKGFFIDSVKLSEIDDNEKLSRAKDFILSKGKNDRKVNLFDAASLLKEYLPGIDARRAERYAYNEATKAGIATDASFVKKVGMFFENVGDFFRGARKPEQILMRDRDMSAIPKTSQARQTSAEIPSLSPKTPVLERERSESVTSTLSTTSPKKLGRTESIESGISLTSTRSKDDLDMERKYPIRRALQRAEAQPPKSKEAEDMIGKNRTRSKSSSFER